MAAEDVGHVLSRVHEALVPGGWLLDLHLKPPGARVLDADGRKLGRIDQRGFSAMVRASELGVKEAIARGLFTSIDLLRLQVRERFDSGVELVEEIPRRRGVRVARALEKGVRAATGPVHLSERIVLWRLRAR